MATGDNKYLQILYGRRGKLYRGLNPLVPDYALEAGAAVFDDFMLDAPVSAVDGNATADQAVISLAANTATASSGSDGNATTNNATINLVANTVTASGTTVINGNAATNNATINLVANTATASGTTVINGNASTNQAIVNLVANTATASGTAPNGNATANQAQISITANDVTATGTGAAPTVVVQGISGKKHKPKKHVTYADRREQEQKIVDLLTGVVKETVSDNNAEAIVSTSVITNTVNDIIHRSDYVSDTSTLFNEQYLTEIARLQTYLLLEELRRKIQQDDEELLMLL